MKEQLAVTMTTNDENIAGRKAADLLAHDWENRDWVPLSPTLQWARAATDRFSEIIAGQPAMFRASMKGADRGASTLSPRPFQGFIECLQNADDLGASTLHIAYRGTPQPELLIVHDGAPVTLAHVGAMLLPWLSTKDGDADATGRFGIGQRTLGALGGPITLHAPPFHFLMGDNGPISVEPSSDVHGIYQGHRRDTMLVIPLVESVTSEKIVEAVHELDVDSLIFLQSIRILRFHHLDDPSQNLVFAVEVTPQQCGRIEFDGESAIVDIQDVQLVLATGGRQYYRRYSTRRPLHSGKKRTNKATAASTPIGVCVPMDSSQRPLRLYDRMPLPTFTGLPIGLNAQFDPDAARSTLLPNAWNKERFVDLGQLVAWAALQAFQTDTVTAWNHVPLMAEANQGQGWAADQIRQLIVDASHVALRDQLTLQSHSGATPLADIAYEDNELEALLNENDVEQLTESKVALPRTSRDSLGRWRLVLGELARCEIVEVLDALDVLDGDPKRGADWYVLFATIAEQHGLFRSFIARRGLLLADGTATALPASTEIWVLVKTASPEALATRLGLARRLHPAYFGDDAGPVAFLSKLKGLGVLFDDRDTTADVFSIFERGSSGGPPATVKLEDADLLALRNAWAEFPRERHASLGRKVGQWIELKATWYDAKGRQETGWARPVDMYLPAAIDREVDSFAKAAGRAPGLKWVDGEYAKVLKQTSGRSAIGAQRLLSAWGVAREPRLIKPLDERVLYTRDTRPASPIATRMRTAEQLQSIRTGGTFTHLLDDHWSPDADAVAEDIARASIKTRRKRGAALLATLSRVWDKRYSEFSTAFTTYGYNGWQRGVEIRATWLARLADIKWMPDAGNGLQRPSDLQLQIPGRSPIPSERSFTVAKVDSQIQRSGVLAALGVKAGPTQRDLVDRLRALRKEPVTAVIVAEALATYQLLAASLRDRSDGVPDGRMTAAQLKNAFRAGSERLGLLLVGDAWQSPETLLRGPAIFGSRRVFAPHVEGLEPLWITLGVSLPVASDAIAVLREIASGRPSPKDLGVAIRALTLVSEGIVDMSPQMRATLRRLPLWTGTEWTSERPVYALEGEALLTNAPANMKVWRPGLTSFAAISSLLEPLGVVCLSPSDFRPASVPAYGMAEGEGIRAIFAKAVALLKQELVRADQTLLDGLTVEWEQLITAPVVVDPNLSIVADLLSGQVRLPARAHVGREPLCLIVRSPLDAGTSEGAGGAIASLFDGDRQKAAWAWAAVWPRAVAGEQAEGAVLPKTRAEPGDGQERLDQLLKQVTRRSKGKTPPGIPGTKADIYSSSVQVRKLRELDDLDPSAGTIVNGGATPSGNLVFAKRQKATGKREYDPDALKDGSNESPPQRTVLPPTSDRERMALEVVRCALRLDAQQLNDLRNARGVGVDAIDELRQCYEIKMSSDSAIPNDITLTASEVEAARKDPDFFLAVVSGLEDGAGKLRVRFIFNPLTQLDVRVRGDLTLTGVSRAEALEFEFDKKVEHEIDRDW
ncbi:sacsin N-terminal ATP-binding-like domain-containing protein [Pseudomonas sp. FW300-N2A2]|uniref:sacsin N-terminal ATP-binding-like domain-containing protein n=1 Tax=Pseudomonas sp. FW300-N2A2 TaxID=2751316 RepID=UPI001A920CD1|nr:hypothetical protein [Pseudomonas sp. FW300-N2A2]